MKNKLKVLALGWEFPPIINGGLGIACYNLFKSLAEYVELTVILPQTDINYTVNNIELIGLNQLKETVEREVIEEQTNYVYDTFAKVEYIKVQLSPYESEYYVENIVYEDQKRAITETHKFIYYDEVSVFDNFNREDDLFAKVNKFASLAVSVAESLEFDLIYAHDWMTLVAGVEIKKKFNKPLVSHIHSLETDRAGRIHNSMIYEVEKQCLKECDKIISVSNYSSESINKYYHIPENKINTIYNGLDSLTIFRTPKPYSDKLVVYLGRFVGQKGPDAFIEVANKVLAKCPNTRFVMAGTGEKLKTSIEMSAYKHLGSRIHFTGYLDRPKVHQLLSMADVYCMPSVSEPFGIAAIEAAQFGVPCVLTKQSGVSEVLTKALQANFWDTELMASHIIRLLTDDEFREKIVNDTSKNLMSLNWYSSADKVYDIMKNL